MTAIAKPILAMAVAAFSLGAPGWANATEPYGTWVRPSSGTLVKFYACGDRLCARVSGAIDTAQKNNNGPVIMKNAKKSSDSTWEGDLIDAESGKIYSGIVTLQSANALNLKGCLAIILCRSETWTRVK
jgi:uncharacterized protein (DUF2147 family)